MCDEKEVRGDQSKNKAGSAAAIYAQSAAAFNDTSPMELFASNSPN
jgi:hypothetical protein